MSFYVPFFVHRTMYIMRCRECGQAMKIKIFQKINTKGTIYNGRIQIRVLVFLHT